MNVVVLNDNFESIFVIDSFKSLIWTDRYNIYGDFELYLPTDISILKILKHDYYLWIKESERMMIIDDIYIESDIEDGSHITVKGKSLEYILSRRVICGMTSFQSQLLSKVIQDIITKNFISPTDTKRKISNFIYKPTDIATEKVTSQFFYENVYDIVSKLCIDNNIGFKILLNSDNKFEFSLYKGEDRSFSQIVNPFVIFSPNYENILNTNYLTSISDLKTVAYVGGEGDNSSRIVVESSPYEENLKKGLYRRETFVNGGSISKKNEDGSPISNSDYQTLLKDHGTVELDNHKIKTAFEGEIDTSRSFIYGRDFFIGDIVQLTNEYGHEGKARISEVIISQNEEGFSIHPTFQSVS